MSGPKVTFYGHFSGWSSYPTVCRAVARWLHQRGVDLELCDLRPDRTFDEIEDVPKASKRLHRQVFIRAHDVEAGVAPERPSAAGVSLLFGFPAWSRAIPRHEWSVGYHVGDVDRVPDFWAEDMNGEDLVLTPSKWCKLAFARSGVRRPIEVVPHGVDDAFAPGGTTPSSQRLVHFCSASDPSRKGSLELIEAARIAMGDMSTFGAALHIYTTSSALQMTIASCPWNQVLAMHRDEPGPPEAMADRLRGAALVVQPSRAEGFGMIGLEALACGVPVVATSCTGHAEYLSIETPGAVVIPTGRLEPCGGARAPSLDPHDVAEALSSALCSYWDLKARAREGSREIREQWSWDAVLGRSSLLKALQQA